MTAKPNIERTGSCKNCGTKDHLEFKMKTNADKSVRFTVSCAKCGAIISEVHPSRDRAKTAVIRKWNEMSEEEFKSLIGLKNKLQEDAKLENKKGCCKQSKPQEDKPVQFKTKSKFTWFKLEKEDMLDFAYMLINNYNKSNAKEECPVTVGDLLRLFGMKEEEIFNILPKVKFSKKHIKSYEDMVTALNEGKILYYTDELNRVWKYSPLRKYLDDETEELIQTLKSSGLTLKNTFISN